MADHDELFDAAQELAGSDSQMRQISETMVRENELQQQLETQEALEADIRTQLADIRTKRLPELMMSAGVEKFTCSETGTEARLTFECSGALGSDEEERERKLDILVANGADEIVRLEVTSAFGKGEYAKAQALAGELNRRGIATAVRRNIHHQTLRSWVKERMEAGDQLPLADVGLWYGQIAKIKRPKAD
jgi:hypothetical protein